MRSPIYLEEEGATVVFVRPYKGFKRGQVVQGTLHHDALLECGVFQPSDWKSFIWQYDWDEEEDPPKTVWRRASPLDLLADCAENTR